MTEVIFVSTKRNSSIGYLQQGTSVPYEKPYFNALVEKVLGKIKELKMKIFQI